MTDTPLPPAMPSTARWPLPSARVRELFRQGAEFALAAPPEWIDEIDQAGLAADGMQLVVDDPVLLAASKRITRVSLSHWAAANVDQPGVPVPGHLSADMMRNARDLARRGAAELIFNASRRAQNAAWQRWMQIAFTLSADPAELQELLNVSARSITAYIDATMSGIAAYMRTVRDEQLRGSHVERRELVGFILEGTPVNLQQASLRLDYPLEQRHHAAVVWSEEADTELGQLEQAAQALARCAGSSHPLTVMASAATLWAWTQGDQPIDLPALRLALKPLAGIRMAIGPAARGVEGFRRAHLDAISTQRVLGRLQAGDQVVSFDMVRLVSLMTRDAEAARHFITHTLGELASAEPVLRRTLLTFLAAGCNATQAATLLHTHRNTLLRRLARAEELLPRPLEHHRVHVAAALEALSWTRDETR